MTHEEREAMNAAANEVSQYGSLVFEQGWQAAKRFYLNHPDDIDVMGGLIRQYATYPLR